MMNAKFVGIGLVCLLAGIVSLAVPVLNAQSNFTFSKFDVPGAVSVATGRAAAVMPEDTFDFPGAAGTLALGINDQGDIVGRYSLGGILHGFLLRDGVFRTIDHPSGIATQLWGINSSGDITGYYRKPIGATTADGTTHGFIRNGTTEVFTPIDVPGTNNTLALKPTPGGQVVGCHHRTIGLNGSGFVTSSMEGYIFDNGTYTILYEPGTMHNGITPDGKTIVGLDFAVFDGGQGDHGYIFIPATNSFNQFDFPDAVFTHAWDINARGEIVGEYRDAANRNHGFLLHNGVFTSIDVPGATHTSAFGINSEGTIVGTYADSTGNHAYIATRN